MAAILSYFRTDASEKVEAMPPEGQRPDDYSFLSKPLAERQLIVQKIMAKYPDRVPVIVLPAEGCRLGYLDRVKYLIPATTPMSYIMTLIRRKLALADASKQALFLYVNQTVPPLTRAVGDFPVAEDGMLYIQYQTESVFG